MKKYSSLLFVCFIAWLLVGCSSKTSSEKQSDIRPIPVIFDTDMGNDVDDALALDILYKSMDKGDINLLALMLNKKGEGAAKFLDIMNTWYGYPQLPIGIAKNIEDGNENTNYAQSVCDLNLFPTTLTDYANLPDAHILYRKLLAAQPDHSVVIISTGFSTNLARLLDTPADEYSDLNGKELIKQKVKYMSLMAGAIKMADHREFNIIQDLPAAQKLFAECPVPLVTSPFEVGNAIKYPAKSIENDFGWAPQHPMVEAYKAYMQMPYDRQTWDLTAVLQVLHPNEYMTCSEEGKITVDEVGLTHFVPMKGGMQYYLMTNEEQNQKILDYFLSIIPQKPKSKQ